jgi:methylglutaconyl-CoA hydratase
MTEMKYSSLRSGEEERICRITLQRGKCGNALDDALLGELLHAFSSAAKEPEIRVIVLSAEGEEFCTGMDARAMLSAAPSHFEQNVESSKRLIQLYSLISSMRKPVIASVNGSALSEGCGLVAACDIVVASTYSSFGFPDVRLGAIPALALPFLIQRVGKGNARRMVLQGSVYTAAEAHVLGLVDEVVEEGTLEENTTSLARQLATQTSVTAVGLAKDFLANCEGMNSSATLDYAVDMNAVAQMSDDFKRGRELSSKKDQIRWT